MTICDGTNSVVANTFAVLGGTFRLRINDSTNHYREAEVLDDDDNVIGYATTLPYNDAAWSIHTRPWAGYVPFEQVELV